MREPTSWPSCDDRVLHILPADRPVHAATVARPSLLVPIFVVWAVTCVGVGAAFHGRAPAVSLAVFGSVLGAIARFLVGNADGPAGVPAATAVGASIGLCANGVLGLFMTSARPPAGPLRRAAMLVLIAAPLAAGVVTLLLRLTCPMYVTASAQGSATTGTWMCSEAGPAKSSLRSCSTPRS